MTAVGLLAPESSLCAVWPDRLVPLKTPRGLPDYVEGVRRARARVLIADLAGMRFERVLHLAALGVEIRPGPDEAVLPEYHFSAIDETGEAARMACASGPADRGAGHGASSGEAPASGAGETANQGKNLAVGGPTGGGRRGELLAVLAQRLVDDCDLNAGEAYEEICALERELTGLVSAVRARIGPGHTLKVEDELRAAEALLAEDRGGEPA